MADYYVATTGDDVTGDGSSANPWATPGYAVTQLLTGDTLWIKSGTYTLSTSTPGSGGPVVLPQNMLLRIEGYNTTTGDLGTAPVINAGAQTSVTLITINGNYGSKRQLVRNVEVDGNSGSGNVGFGQGAGAGYYQCRLARCIARNCPGNGYSGAHLIPDHCKAISNAIGFDVTRASRCWADSNTSHGFNVKSSQGAMRFCIASNNSGDGFVAGASGYESEFDTCIAHNNTSDGFASVSYGMNHCFHCIAVNNGAYGFTWANTDGVLIGCASYNNTSGRQTGVGLDLDSITLSGDPFVDAVNDDFNLNNTAGAGATLRAVELALAP